MDPSGISSHCNVKTCSLCPGDTEYYCHICNLDLCLQCKEEHVINLDTLNHNVTIYRQKCTHRLQTERTVVLAGLYSDINNSETYHRRIDFCQSEMFEKGQKLKDSINAVQEMQLVLNIYPRWQRCVSNSNAAFGYANSSLYIQDYFDKESKSKVLAIVNEIEEAFIRGIPPVAWMDDKTREIAIEKVRKIVQMIGYPDWILDTVQLDKYYQNVTLLPKEFLLSHLNIRREAVPKNHRKLGTVPDRLEWHMMPVDTNAYYSQSNNQIVFPAGILQRPFFTPSFPITTGPIPAKFGRNHPWVKAHQAPTLKGERVLGENIADNGGLKTAFTAYKQWERSQGSAEVKNLPGLSLTQEQLFFVGFGQLWCSYYTPQYTKQAILTDEHTICKFRTIGVVSNSGDFSRAFQCAPNTPMNPQTKCQVW
uniref:Endothelin-converting enzyme 2-like n=1 Tax=Crassostrea virginica TaxID=6565 RepID=A0A8B8C7Z5_CRAVI|nr:endothelin-converting enzyme 2-like [Crassostrea virginica]